MSWAEMILGRDDPIYSAHFFSHGRNHFVFVKYYTFCDITNSNSRKIDFVISINQVDFVISQIRFCDITNSIL